MNFDLTAEQKMLKKSAAEFFSKEVDGELVRKLEADDIGHSQKIWKKMANLGWCGLLVPEEYDGEGMDFQDLSVILEEMGKSAMPSPFFTSCVISALVLIKAGSETQKKKLLPHLSAGKKIFTLAWSETNTAMDPLGISATARPEGEHYEISGCKSFVPYAHISDFIIVAARTADLVEENPDDGISLFLVNRNTKGINIDLIDNSSGEKFCEVSFDKVRVPLENKIGEINQGWKILESVLLMCAVAECAKIVGSGEKALKMTVDYAKKRKQFGQAIGSFQAIQHHCANMQILLDTSQLLTWQTSFRISIGDDWEQSAGMCKAWAAKSLRQMIMLGHQIMGGFGFMEEVDLQLFYRRARTAELLFGSTEYHNEKIAQCMGL